MAWRFRSLFVLSLAVAALSLSQLVVLAGNCERPEPVAGVCELCLQFGQSSQYYQCGNEETATQQCQFTSDNMYCIEIVPDCPAPARYYYNNNTTCANEPDAILEYCNTRAYYSSDGFPSEEELICD